MEPLKKAAQSHDLAVLLIRHAGKDGKGRGSSQFEAAVDIVATLRRPEGNHPKTVRQLETIGRYGATKSNIELTDEGYVQRGSDNQIQFGKAVEAIRQHAPRTFEDAMTQDELFEVLKDEGVSKKTMQRALDWLYDNGRGELRREGKGAKGDPYRYWLPPDDPYTPPPPSPDDDFPKYPWWVRSKGAANARGAALPLPRLLRGGLPTLLGRWLHGPSRTHRKRSRRS
jgi:hypothetical protein